MENSFAALLYVPVHMIAVGNVQSEWFKCNLIKKAQSLMGTVNGITSYQRSFLVARDFSLWLTPKHPAACEKKTSGTVNPESIHGHLWECLLRKCKNTEFVRDLKQGFVKVAIRTWNSLLRELPLHQ